MKLRESEDLLFARWRPNRPRFVADGVADEQAYNTSKPRLVFVLKEVNDPDGGDWDLRQFIYEGGRPQTWDNITRWVEGIRRLDENLPWAILKEISLERRCKALRSIVAINLKKSPGSHTTDQGQLAIVAAEDKAFFNEQFKLYEPNIVICCGVSDTFHWTLQHDAEPRWQATSRGVWFHKSESGRVVVSYSHPEARCADNLLYYGLVDAIREIVAT